MKTTNKQTGTVQKPDQQDSQIILEAIPAPILISRLSDSKVLYANQALSKIGKIGSKTLIGGRTVDFFADPEDSDKVAGILQMSGHVSDFKVQLKRGDGTLYWALLSASIINYKGETCVLSSYADISEHIQVEEALKAHDEFSQKQSSVFAELARSEVLYSGDIQAAFAEVTEAAARTLNVRRASIWYYNEARTEIRCMDLFEQGKGHSEGIILTKADFPSYFKALDDEKVIAANNAHTDPATREFSASYLTPLGINSMLDAPIRMRGNVIGVICNEHVGPIRQWTMEEQNFARMIVDFVTVAVETQERKQAEERVRQSESNLSSALQVANMAYWEFDLRAQMFTFNDQYYSLHGRTAQEVGGYHVSTERFAQEFVYPEDAATVGAAIQKAIESTGIEFQIQSEARIIHADDKPHWVAVWFRIEKDAQGNTIKVHGVNQDITERKQAEEALKAHDEFSQKQSSAFAELARSERLYSGDIQAAFAEVTEAAARMLNVQRASIWYYNETRTEIRCMDLFEQGKDHSEGIVLSQADFPSYFKALEDEKVIAADNAHTDPATHEFSASYLTPLDINSMLDAPIRLRGQVIGVICNEHVGPFRSWTLEEQNFARMVVDFVTIAIETQERKQLEQQIQTAFEHRGRQVQISTEVSQSIAAVTSLDELYQRVVTQVKEKFGYYHTQILRYEAAQKAVVLVAGYGEIGAQMLAAGYRLPMGEGPIGAAAATGETVLRPTLENDPERIPNPLLPDTKGEIAVPIKLGDNILGILDVQSNNAGALSSEDKLLLEGLSGQIATAIESTRLRQEMDERLAEVDRLYRAMSHEGWQVYRQTESLPTGFIYNQMTVAPIQEPEPAKGSFIRQPIAVPGGEIIGTLSIAEDPQYPLSSEDISMVQQITEQIALALESARLFDQTQSALTQSETLFQASRRLTQAIDLPQLVKSIAETVNIPVVNRIDLDLLSFNSEGSLESLELVANWWNGTGPEPVPVGTRYPLELLSVMKLFVSPTPIFSNDTFMDERIDGASLQFVKQQNIRSAAVLPLYVGTKQIGAVVLVAGEPYNFSPEEIRLFTAMAPQIATVVENRRQYEMAQKQAKRESMLNIINQKIQSATSVEEVLQIAARELGRALDAPMTIAQLSMKETASQQ